jgi:hypothetical protein
MEHGACIPDLRLVCGLQTCWKFEVAGYLPDDGDRVRARFPGVKLLRLEQPFGTAQGTLWRHMNDKAACLETPLCERAWQRLATFTHLTSLCIRGSFGLRLALETQQLVKYVPITRAADSLDLDYYFGPDAASSGASTAGAPPRLPFEGPPPTAFEAGYIAQSAFVHALRCLAPSLRALTLENAPLSPELLDGIAMLTRLTQLRLPVATDASDGVLLGTLRVPRLEMFPDLAQDGFLARVLVARPRLPLAALPELAELVVSDQIGVHNGSLSELDHAHKLTKLDLRGCRHVQMEDLVKARCDTAPRMPSFSMCSCSI